ncbi:MAG: methyl-accepting chemotaxis protein [Pseudomonadota bacterium]
MRVLNSISAKIFLSFLVLLLLIAGLSGTALFGLRTVSGIVDDYEVSTQKTLEVSQMHEELLLARMAGFQYRQGFDQRYAEEAIGHLSLVVETVPNLDVVDQSDEKAVKKFKKTLFRINTYRTALSNAVEEQKKFEPAAQILSERRSEIENSLSTLGQQVASTEQANQISAISAAFFQTMGALDRYTVTGDDQSNIAVSNGITNAELDLEKFAQSAEAGLADAARNVIAELQNLGEGYRALNKIMIDRGSLLTNGLDRLGPAAQKDMQALLQGVLERQGQFTTSAQATAERIDMITLAVAALCIIIGLIAAFILSRQISGGIVRITKAMRSLSEGNTLVDVPGTSRKDEIGQMAAALRVFKENAEEMTRLAAERSDLEHQQRQSEHRSRTETAERFEAQLGAIARSVADETEKLRGVAGDLGSAASQSQTESDAVSESANAALHRVESVATATEEMSASISEVSRLVAQSARVAAQSVENAEKTRTQLDVLNTAIHDVDEITQDISTIAEQTNLLALNATIEAARAGDAGKGFAVVANEVKSLATGTKTLTETISERVQRVSQVAAEAISATRLVIESIGEIDESANAIKVAVDQQASATHEISSNAQGAASGTGHVTSSMDTIRTATNRTTQASGVVTEVVESLSVQATKLNSGLQELVRDLQQQSA